MAHWPAFASAVSVPAQAAPPAAASASRISMSKAGARLAAELPDRFPPARSGFQASVPAALFIGAATRIFQCSMRPRAKGPRKSGRWTRSGAIPAAEAPGSRVRRLWCMVAVSLSAAGCPGAGFSAPGEPDVMAWGRPDYVSAAPAFPILSIRIRSTQFNNIAQRGPSASSASAPEAEGA